MSLDLARARAALTSEVAALEKLLEREAGWRALRNLAAQSGAPAPHRLGGDLASDLPEYQRDALNRNPLFLARASLLEALCSLPDSKSDEASTTEPQCERQPELQFEPAPATAPPATPSSPAERIDAAISGLVSRARALPPPDMTPEPSVALEAKAPTPTRIPIVDESGDDLRHIAFIDNEVAARLNASGILKFSDVAHLTVDQVALISVRFGLGNRVSREQWIEQAAILASGGSTAYARQVQTAELGPEPAASPLQPSEPPALPASAHSMPDVLPLLISEPALDTDLAGEPLPGIAPPQSPSSVTQPSAGAVQPPPLPERGSRHAPSPAQYEHGTDGHAEHADAQVRFVARLRERPRAGMFAADPGQLSQRRWARDDRPLARNSHHWDTAEEAAVEIVARPPPFPGVGPVQEAARRLQSATEAPTSTLSGILKALRRR